MLDEKALGQSIGVKVHQGSLTHLVCSSSLNPESARREIRFVRHNRTIANSQLMDLLCECSDSRVPAAASELQQGQASCVGEVDSAGETWGLVSATVHHFDRTDHEQFVF